MIFGILFARYRPGHVGLSLELLKPHYGVEFEGLAGTLPILELGLVHAVSILASFLRIE